MKWFKPKVKPENLSPGSQSKRQRSPSKRVKPVEYAFAPDDPFLEYMRDSTSVVDIDSLQLESNALNFLKTIGVRIVLPLISQGELIGMLNLGPRMSQQDYSIDDRRLLSDLATQAAPALRVAQLARQQQIEARQRERIEQELRLGRVIQETLLPQSLPSITNLELDALWKPAREVSGDFYDFIEFPDGKLGIIVGDVTDKGVPAALVMATTRTILHSTAERLISPGIVLERANDLLVPSIPQKMFVTCLYMLIEPASGKLIYANAGHNPPYQRTQTGVDELFARGMPLGLMPGMVYDEETAEIGPGECILFYSDGVTEAHNPNGDMFGFPRLRDYMSTYKSDENLIPGLLDELAKFTGAGWEQEDDVTFVAVRWVDEKVKSTSHTPEWRKQFGDWDTLLEFEVMSIPGNERLVESRVIDAALGAGFSTERIDRLGTAVTETALNAIEHGNQYDMNKRAKVSVFKSNTNLAILISDKGKHRPYDEPVIPNLEEKLDGHQSPRGWGLFLIENMVDDMEVHDDPGEHTVALFFKLNDEGN